MDLFSSKKRFFEKFYDQHLDKVYRFIFLKVSSVEISQDLTAETFLRFWQTIKGPNKIEDPRAFLYQIARNLVIDYYRQNNPFLNLSVEELVLVDPRPGPEKEAELEAELQALLKELQKLPDSYQDALVWHYLDDLSVKEISQILDKSENAVRLIIHRGLRSLKACFKTENKRKSGKTGKK